MLVRLSLKMETEVCPVLPVNGNVEISIAEVHCGEPVTAPHGQKEAREGKHPKRQTLQKPVEPLQIQNGPKAPVPLWYEEKGRIKPLPHLFRGQERYCPFFQQCRNLAREQLALCGIPQHGRHNTPKPGGLGIELEPVSILQGAEHPRRLGTLAPVKQVLRREAHSRRLTTVSDGPCL